MRTVGAAEQPDITARVIRLRHGFLDALVWEDWAGLRRLVKTVCEFDPTPVLAETGIVSLLSDASLDRHLGPVAPYRQAAIERWRIWAGHLPVKCRARSPTAATRGKSWKCDDFRSQVRSLERNSWISIQLRIPKAPCTSA